MKNLVLPAADEAEPLWINKFGFSKLPPEEVHQSNLSSIRLLHVMRIIKNWLSENSWCFLFSLFLMQVMEYKRHYQMMVFQGTSMLQKTVPQYRVISSAAKIQGAEEETK